MMEESRTDDRELLRETTAKFLEKYGSLARVRERTDDANAFDAEAWHQGADLGWVAMLASEGHGGGSVTGEGLLDLVEIARELGRFLHPAPFLPTNVVAFAISTFGSEDLKEEFVPGIVAGDVTGAWCFSEASGSVDPADIELVARKTPNGYELQGTKYFVQDGHCAALFLVTASDGAGGLTQLAVRRDTPGVVCTPMACIDFSRRVAEVRFDSVTVPASAVVGTAGQAADDIAQQLAVALVLQCADSVGALAQVNEMTFQYAIDRFAFGRPIGSFQAIKHRCVEMYLASIGAASITSAAAEAVEQRSSDAEVLVSVAKAFVGDAFSRSVEHCHQIHGGIAFTWEHNAHLYMRHAKFNEAMFGSPQWNRDRLGRLLDI
jgi:alkylation response protein AidB-like acyl-CoA dehydrogenase